MKRAAPYGTWPSPWTAERIATAEVRLAEVRLAGGSVYWLERRPAEGGRSVVVRLGPDGRAADAVPAGANARNAVYEYGGGSYVVADSGVVYTEFADARVWIAPPTGVAFPLTPLGPWRFADLTLDPARPRLYAIQEDRSRDGEPAHRVVVLDLESPESAPIAWVEGEDFYSSPAPSPDGTKLAFLSWRHPDMPWDATELWVADLDRAGRPGRISRVAGGGGAESIREPRWSPGGALCFVSDRTGFWNLYRFDPAGGEGDAGSEGGRPRRSSPAPRTAEQAGRIIPLAPLDAEVGGPQWVFGESFYTFAAEDDVVFAANHRGLWRLYRLRGSVLQELPSRFTETRYLQSDGGRVVLIGASPAESSVVAAIRLGSGAEGGGEGCDRSARRPPGVTGDDDREVEVLRRSSDPIFDPGYLSQLRAIEIPTTGGARAHAFFYPPANAELEGPPDERPPLLVICHGGPTSGASSALSPAIQFWTSRGFAVVDLNYRGSTGFGRVYRESLYGAWGVAEVDDCVAAARHLAAEGVVDAGRLVIRGGSAGGYTTLAALAFRDTFTAGASYYGIGDLEALARDTHKFESRYLERLIGPYPARRDLYVERSPIHAADRLSCPVIFFQGLEDKVVPPNQAEAMVAALRRKGLPVAYVTFPGEQHGFRRAESIRRALECELYFYSRVFGFELPDRPALPLEIENLGSRS